MIEPGSGKRLPCLVQEVWIPLAKANREGSLVAGIAVAPIAIVAVRMIIAGADRLRSRLWLKR